MRSFDPKTAVNNLFLRMANDPSGWTGGIENLSENVIGMFPLPLSIVKMTVGGRERLVPLVTEEAGVVAGIAKAAKLCGQGGFTVETGINNVRAVALIADVPNVFEWPFEYELYTSPATMRLEQFRQELVREGDPFEKHGGGLTRIKARRIGPDIELLLSCDTGEAMGAAGVTRLAERVGRAFTERVGGTLVSAIVANNGSGRFTAVEASWKIGEDISRERAKCLVKIDAWAQQSYFRAITHNKGVLNGLAAAALPMGQDLRAISVAAEVHAHGKDGKTHPLSHFRIEGKKIIGSLDVIIPCGTVGGATQHPTAVACRKLAGIESANDLAGIIAAAGLASNFASLLQLASPEGFSATYEKLRR